MLVPGWSQQQEIDQRDQASRGAERDHDIIDADTLGFRESVWSVLFHAR